MEMFTKIVNNPKDRIIKGKAKAVAIGFTMEFMREKINPAEIYNQASFAYPLVILPK